MKNAKAKIHSDKSESTKKKFWQKREKNAQFLHRFPKNFFVPAHLTTTCSPQDALHF